MDGRYRSIYRFRAGDRYARSSQTLEHDSLVIVTGGVFSSLDADGDGQEAGPGDVLFFRAGLSHDSWNDPARPTRCLRLLFDRYAPDTPALPKLLHDEDGRIRLVGQWLVHTTHVPTDPAVCDGYLQAIFAECQRLSSATMDSLVRRTLGYIRQNLGAKITLEHLADHVGLSRCHFARRFQRLTSTTPMREVQRLRLQEARRLLLTTHAPLKTIAMQVGLTDAAHLSNLLRQYYGCGARELRAAGTWTWEQKASSGAAEAVAVAALPGPRPAAEGGAKADGGD